MTFYCGNTQFFFFDDDDDDDDDDCNANYDDNILIHTKDLELLKLNYGAILIRTPPPPPPKKNPLFFWGGGVFI